MDIGTSSESYFVTSGSPFYNLNGFRNSGAIFSDWSPLDQRFPTPLLRDQSIIDQEFGADVTTSRARTGRRVDLYGSSTGQGTFSVSDAFTFFRGYVSEVPPLLTNEIPSTEDLTDLPTPNVFLDYGRALDSDRGFLVSSANGGIMVRKSNDQKYLFTEETVALSGLGFDIPVDEGLAEQNVTNTFGESVSISSSDDGALLVGDPRLSSIFAYEFKSLDLSDCNNPEFEEAFDNPKSWLRSGRLSPSSVIGSRFGSEVSLSNRGAVRQALSIGNISVVEQVDSSDECQTSTQLLNQRAVFTYQLEENTELDCNGNMIEDSCEIADNPLIDCINSNGIIDTCEGLFDCNFNCIPDDLDLVFGNSTDIDFDGILDECDPDDDNDDIPDECDVDQTEGDDCNEDGIIDSCQISLDCYNENGIPDICECICDLDGDGIVGQSDRVIVLSAYGESCTDCIEDLNCDGLVGFEDLILILNNEGDCP